MEVLVAFDKLGIQRLTGTIWSQHSELMCPFSCREAQLPHSKVLVGGKGIEEYGPRLNAKWAAPRTKHYNKTH